MYFSWDGRSRGDNKSSASRGGACLADLHVSSEPGDHRPGHPASRGRYAVRAERPREQGRRTRDQPIHQSQRKPSPLTDHAPSSTRPRRVSLVGQLWPRLARVQRESRSVSDPNHCTTRQRYATPPTHPRPSRYPRVYNPTTAQHTRSNIHHASNIGNVNQNSTND